MLIQVWDLRTGSVFETLTFSDPISSLRFNAGRIMSTTDTNDINVRKKDGHEKKKKKVDDCGKKLRVNLLFIFIIVIFRYITEPHSNIVD